MFHIGDGVSEDLSVPGCKVIPLENIKLDIKEMQLRIAVKHAAGSPSAGEDVESGGPHALLVDGQVVRGFGKQAGSSSKG